jgi:uncharacterized membrane-anchored protein YhcB (DUF1043 family)
MDPNQITTTFIPKKPLQQSPEETGATHAVRTPMGTLMVISIIIGILAAISLVGVFLYKQYVIADVENIQKALKTNEKELEPNLIADLTKLDKQLKNGETLLRQHIAPSPIFDLIEQNTLKQVRFSKFEFRVDNNMYDVNMSGEANNYQSIALQSQNFGDVTAFRDVIFSDFTLTPKNRISFTVSFKVNTDILNFSTAPIRVISSSVTPTPAPTETLAPVDTTSQPIDQTPLQEEPQVQNTSTVNQVTNLPVNTLSPSTGKKTLQPSGSKTP